MINQDKTKDGYMLKPVEVDKRLFYGMSGVDAVLIDKVVAEFRIAGMGADGVASLPFFLRNV